MYLEAAWTLYFKMYYLVVKTAHFASEERATEVDG